MKKLLIPILTILFMQNLAVNAQLLNDQPQNPDPPINKTPFADKNKFKDLDPDNWAYQAVVELSQKYKILAGMPDGNYLGKKSATRYELAQALAKVVQKIDQDNIHLSAVEQAAIKSLKTEFENEIIALAARIEKNETNISNLEKKHYIDVDNITNNIKNIEKRHYFIPEMRFQYGVGDVNESDGPYANARLRLNSVTKIDDSTIGVIRMQALTGNMVKQSEVNGDIVDADVTLAYVSTEDLTKWIPEKFGKVNFTGGLLPTNVIFYKNYTVNVDQRGFSDANNSISLYNDQLLGFSRELPDSRRMGIGGEYIKTFSKYNAEIKGFGTRGSSGSFDIAGNDLPKSAKNTTFYAVTGKVDLPVPNQPIQLKLTHTYSFDDNGVNANTYTIGGRLATKFKNFGVAKFAVIGYGGSVPPRYLGGWGGHGVNYQFAFNPTSKLFGNLFGNPDKISYDMPNYQPGKTEIGFAVGNYHNSQEQGMIAFDLFMSRYFTDNIFGRIILTHLEPTDNPGSLTSKTSLLMETIFKM